MKTYLKIIAIATSLLAITYIADIVVTHIESHSYLSQANSLKYELLKYYENNEEIIESLMYDGFDDELTYSPDDFEQALIENGYYDNIAKIDSIIKNECN